MSDKQAKGSATRIVKEWESDYKTLRTAADRRPIRVPFNRSGLKGSRSQQQSETLTGDRNPTAPFQGNKTAGGDLVVPVDPRSMGFDLCALLGYPISSVEKPISTGDLKTGSPTISIVSGGYTFSGAQADVTVRSRVVYEKSGVVYVGYLTVVTNSTTGTIQTALTGGSNSANVTGATVLAVMQNKVNSTPGTIDIVDGVGTFSNAPTTPAIGHLVLYGTNKAAWIKTVNSTTEVVLRGPAGINVIEDVEDAAVEFVGVSSYKTHMFIIDPTASVPSFATEVGFTDMTTPFYDVFTGCKLNTIDFEVGGDGELTATETITAADDNPASADNGGGTTAYDASPAETAVPVFTTRFEQRHAYAYEGGVAATNITTFKLTLTNNLDTTSFVVGGGGVRDDLPEGKFGVSGSINALFKNVSTLNKAKNGTVTSLRVGFTRDNYTLDFNMPEVEFQDTTPEIQGPSGIRLPLDFQGYKATSQSAVIVTLTTDIWWFTNAPQA